MEEPDEIPSQGSEAARIGDEERRIQELSVGGYRVEGEVERVKEEA
jgi:hypothetical protein